MTTQSSKIPVKLPAPELRRDYLHGQIANIIEEMIASENLKPGQRLPSERELSAMFKVNRATLRLAIRLVEQRGLVEMRVGSGIYVRNVPRTLLAETIERYVSFKSCSKSDLLAFREIVEPEIVILATRSAREEDHERLREYADEIIEKAEGSDLDGYAAADAAFHEALAVASQNEFVIAVMSGIHRVMQNWIKKHHGQLSVAHHSQLIREGAYIHRRIADAIVQGDEQGAREAMLIHMRVARTALAIDVTAGEKHSIAGVDGNNH